MKITAQEEYGLRCLLRLAAAGTAHSATIPDIAAAEGLSIPYVAKLLALLRSGGLIVSERGRHGGYRLADTPDSIGLGRVLTLLGEPLFDEPDYCQRHAGTETDGQCVHQGCCSLRPVWFALDAWVRRALDTLTLADLLEGEDRILHQLRERFPGAEETLRPSNHAFAGAFVEIEPLKSS